MVILGNGHLAAFNSGKVGIVAISDPFADHNYMVFLFHYDSPYDKLHDTGKAGNRKLTIREGTSPFSRNESLMILNGMYLQLVLSLLWNLPLFSLPQRRLGSI